MSDWTTVPDTRVSLDGVMETRRARVMLAGKPSIFLRLVGTEVP
jgi:hypothetical protein